MYIKNKIKKNYKMKKIKIYKLNYSLYKKLRFNLIEINYFEKWIKFLKINLIKLREY